MKILSQEIAQHYISQSLNRGHVVFTSFVRINGRFIFLEDHLNRLLEGANFLFSNEKWPTHKEEIKQYIQKHLALVQGDLSIRVTIFDDLLYLQYRGHLTSSEWIKVTNANKMKTPGLNPDFLKTSNYLDTDLELKQAQQNGYDDVLFFSFQQDLTEASTSNILILDHSGQLLTPPTSSMVLNGVTRNQLLRKCTEIGANIKESIITTKDLSVAKEIWFINAIKGMRFVIEYNEKKFESNNSLFQMIKSKFGRYGELV